MAERDNVNGKSSSRSTSSELVHTHEFVVDLRHVPTEGDPHDDVLSTSKVALELYLGHISDGDSEKKDDQGKWFLHVYYSFTFCFTGLFVFALLVGSECVPSLHEWKEPSYKEVWCLRTGLRYADDVSCDCATNSSNVVQSPCVSQYPCLLVDVTYMDLQQLHVAQLTETQHNSGQCYVNLSLTCDVDVNLNAETVRQVELEVAASAANFPAFLSTSEPSRPLVATGITMQPLSTVLHCLLWPIAFLSFCAVWFIVSIVVFCRRHIGDVLQEREQLQKSLSSHRSLQLRRHSVFV